MNASSLSSAYRVRYLTGTGEASAWFATSQEAWAFFRSCEPRGIVAGFPSLGKEEVR
jgi:hypothetical protein